MNRFGVGALAQAEQSIEPSMRADFVKVGAMATLRGFAYVAMISATSAVIGALVGFFMVGRHRPTDRQAPNRGS